jgi:hypothetical protein
LSTRERERLKVLHEAEEGHLKQIEPAWRLRLNDRQVRRLQVRLGREGDRGIVHRLRGGRSHKIPEVLKQRALCELRRACYAGFGPTLASEHLAQRGVRVTGHFYFALTVPILPALTKRTAISTRSFSFDKFQI